MTPLDPYVAHVERAQAEAAASSREPARLVLVGTWYMVVGYDRHGTPYPLGLTTKRPATP